MALVAGHKTQVMFGVESVYGTAVTPTKNFDLVETANLTMNSTPIKGGSIGSRAMAYIEAGITDISMNLKGKITAGYPLVYAIGSATPSGAGPYVHTVALASDSEVPALTLEYAADMATDSVITLKGSRCSSLTLTCSKDSALEYSMDFSVYDLTEGTTKQTYTALTDRPLLFSHGILEIPDATSIADVESIEFALNNSLNRSTGMGNRKRGAYGGLLEYTLNADVNYDGPDLLDLALGANGALDSDVELTSMQLKFDNGRATTASRIIDIVSTTVLM